MKLLTIPAHLRAKLGLPKNATDAQVGAAVMAVVDEAATRRRVAQSDAALDRLEANQPADEQDDLDRHYPPTASAAQALDDELAHLYGPSPHSTNG